MEPLILGYGLLGKEIVKQTNWQYISRKRNGLDVENKETHPSLFLGYDTIINCIAHTDTYSNDREKHWNINYEWVADLVDICNKENKKLVHISTDYIYSNNSKTHTTEQEVPVHLETWYGYTKLLGDAHVQLKAKDYLLIRCTHKPYPFKHKKATNQVGNFDYVNVIASLIIKLINGNASGIFNVGTEIKTMQELALHTKEGVETDYYLGHERMPKNTIIDCSKMDKFIKENKL